MSNEKWAVGVAYNFGLVPSEELKDIKLGDYGTVHIDGKTYSLYKAITFGGSREIDKLLDKYGEYPIKDYKLEPVIMSGKFEMILPGFDKETSCIGFGSYTFKCEGKEIPFDFSGVSYDIDQEGDKITIEFQTGKTMMNTNCFLDDCYLDEYKELGIRINDITAKFLSEATEIIDFYIDGEIDNNEFASSYLPEGGKFSLKSLCFSDGVNDYPVKEEVIEAFNNSLNAIDIKVNSIKYADEKGYLEGSVSVNGKNYPFDYNLGTGELDIHHYSDPSWLDGSSYEKELPAVVQNNLEDIDAEVYGKIDEFLKASIKEANVKDLDHPTDDYYDKYDYYCHIIDHPIVFSAELPDNMDKEIDDKFGEIFREKLLVKCCDYGCDTYPNGVTKTIEGKGDYTFEPKVWDFISQMESIFNCKCDYIDWYNGFVFDLEFGPENNRACYSFCAGNNGQEYSQVLYLKDHKQIEDPEFIKALVSLDSNIFVKLEENNLKVPVKERLSSLENKIFEAEEKHSESPDKSNKSIEYTK